MTEKKSARELISVRQCKIWNEFTDLIFEHLPSELCWDLAGKVWQIENLVLYKATTSDEQMEKDHLYETEYISKCRIIVTNEQIASGEANKPLEEVCPYVDCPQYDGCWASENLNPPGFIDYIDFSPKSMIDYTFKTYLADNKQPTPTFKDKAYEKQYYADLEREYRKKGLYST